MKRISIIGSGNVAWHLGHALKNCGCQIVQVHSKTQSNAEKMARMLGAKSAKLNALDSVDLIIIAISDDQTKKVIELIPSSIPVAHTSGRLLLEDVTRSNIGTLYPLQTFSKSRPLNFANIPICVESEDEKLLHDLRTLASRLSNSVHIIPGKQRQVLHLAAVFVSNFTNQMYKEGEEILAQEEMSFDLLRPLILEVAQKALVMAPKDAQTGPAKRKDYETLNTHIEMLEDLPGSLAIYRSITKRILEN